MVTESNNIILIGMAGAGKSTIGPLLAEKLGYSYVDTDDLIAVSRGRSLQEILDNLGQQDFRKLEEQTMLSLSLHRHIIATGGSVIYSDSAMRHLAEIGLIMLLDVDLNTLKKRVNNQNSRGLINPSGSSFDELFRKRRPLYEKYADVTVDCAGLNKEELLDRLVAMIRINRN
ncbi:MAG: shikimate kinase [Desulfobulbaceae bacterium]|nr:shikimate kinase [Desulfobulbaceae bacterium]